MSYPIRALLLLALALLPACQSSSSSGDDDTDTGTDSDTDTDTDTDSDTDTDADGEWCPELETSCEEPTALESCGDDSLEPPRLIFPLSGRHIRDRRPEIIWEVADGVDQYRLEIARDRAFTDVVYRSTEYEPYPDYDDRRHHIVSCDLDCGVHFFRVLSVTSTECEVGSASYTWEMFVGMAPGDLDRDGVPDVAFWTFDVGEAEFDPTYLQAWAFFDLDEKGGETAQPVKVAEIDVSEVIPDTTYWYGLEAIYPGDMNGDGYADLAVAFGYTAEPDDFATARTRVYVFSGLKEGEVQTEADAILGAESAAGKAYHQYNYIFQGHNIRFSDFNGDGLTDAAFVLFTPYVSTDFPSEIRVFFGRTEAQTDLAFSEADAVITCPVWCTVDEGFLRSLFFGDLNGDGFADIIATAQREDEWDHPYHLVVHGSADLGGPVDLATSAAMIGPADVSQQWGDWWWGFYTFNLHLFGDVDRDGFLEAAGWVAARDMTESDPMTTGGFAVLNDQIPAGEHTIDVLVDWLFVGGFEVLGPDFTETISSAAGVGDRDLDGIDDMFFHTDYEPDWDDPERMLRVKGQDSWDDIVDVSLETDDVLLDDERRLLGTVGDIDGDGIPDELYFVQHGVLLSSSDQFVEFGYLPVAAASFEVHAWPPIN